MYVSYFWALRRNMEDDHNVFSNGRSPQFSSSNGENPSFILNGRQPYSFCKLKTTLILQL
jgi:hypothetical protein